MRGRGRAGRLTVVLLAVLLPVGCGERAAQEQGGATRASKVVQGPGSTGASAALDEMRAREIVTQQCLACHGEEMLAQQRLTVKQWTAVLAKMHDWGAGLEADEVGPLAAHLARRHGAGQPAFEPQAVPAAVKQAVEPLPDGRFSGGTPERGKTLYGEVCAGCHGVDGRGTLQGVCLVDRPLLYRAAEFAEVVRRGRGLMPPYPALSDGDIGAVLVHLRTLVPR
jgi:mono/diheme cytochrome c family protein